MSINQTDYPCPFCGVRNGEVQGKSGMFQIVCRGCLARGPLQSNKHSAMRAWYTRTQNTLHNVTTLELRNGENND